MSNLISDEDETQFAPASRLADDIILGQAEQITKQNLIPNLFNIIPYIVLVLNKERQIIYSNNVLFETLGIASQEKLLGLRPGEVLNCVHSHETAGGCGTTECCSVCGAVLAILESQKTKAPVSKECLLTAEKMNDTKCFELAVYAAPAGVIDDEYTLFIVRDISEEKRRQVFEQVFFHDLLNTSGAVKGFVQIMKESPNLSEVQELSTHANEAVDILIDEINSQRDLIAAENGELKLNLSNFSAKGLVTKLVEFYEKYDTMFCSIEIECDEDLIITSDVVLVRRIVNNMLKNAVEASDGDTVSILIEKKDGYAEFRVHNTQSIPREVQLQIFKRSYSNKGSGRGIGTYSMKLLGEKYLGGYISFSCNNGTTFVFGVPMKAKWI
ncbi:HAMP domain-containing sensor histidine kinase [Desulfosporosinus sp. PR]|uniref:sensor histidine kinase n=1 Tax=Candidatus Desulfosporosinus nitrosoreducens TaxID=3401928 RepID=UPI0027F8506D|nr:HAMP domain-containing sensor histidine kinase [Desulfosporosinus sp. PR]MDQ7094830.1 HAMP domain-containing sensor histidine kinase [Desulfosporosinus sp. PR]